jgi:shikimate dehydrogenase
MPAAPTSLYALLGRPVAGNPTQEMVEAAFAAARVDARYVSLEVEPDCLADALRGVRALGVRGLHVTVPHKVAVAGLVDTLTDAARLSGAVNCIKREGGRLVGDNTDGRGFLASLRSLVDPRGTRAAVIGAGGAARAIVAELALAGAAHVSIVNRSLDRAEAVARGIADGTGVPCEADQLVAGWTPPGSVDVVVQATTVGMGDAEARLPLRWSTASGAAVAADVVIAPPRTAFLRDAEAHGYRTLDGLGMLVEQAVAGLEWWLGIEPDRAAMRAAVERELGLDDRAHPPASEAVQMAEMTRSDESPRR